MASKVEGFFASADKWQAEFRKLREIILGCDLSEDLKWGVPCYTHNGKNVLLIHGFKEYCAILFVKGALLKDPQGILVQQTENVQAGRQVRFKSVQDIAKIEQVLRDYILSAIEIEKAGLEVPLKKTSEFTMPEEFQNRLDSDEKLKAAFFALTPGRQRAYLLFFSAPKQAQTRESRIEKSLEKILNGKGLDD